VIEQGGTAEKAFDTVNGTIDSITITMVFSYCKLNICLGVAIDYDLYKKIRDIDMYTEFKMLEVKVLIIFLGTMGVSLRRDGRY
jgi:hypothetical protein